MILDLTRDAAKVLRWRLAALLTLMLLSGAFEGLGLTMMFPVLAKFGVGQNDEGSLQADVASVLSQLGVPDELWALLLVTVALLYLQVIFLVAKAWAQADCQTRYTAAWQQRLFDSFVTAEWKLFTQRTPSARVNSIVNETARVSSAFYLLAEMTTAFVFILVYAGISLAASWQVVTFLFAFGVVAYLVVRPLGRMGQKIGRRVGRSNEMLQHRASEFLSTAKLIKATATEEKAISVFGSAALEYRHAYRIAAFHPKLVFGLYMMAGYTLLGVGLWGAVTWLGLVPASVLVSVYVFLRLYIQLTNLQQHRQGYLVSVPAFHQLQEELEAARALSERLHEGKTLPWTPAAISASNVVVRYPSGLALDRVSLDVESGSVVGITGHSGAGKSTFVDVIVGLIKPEAGEVKIDGVPLEDLALRKWRQSLGYVGQETFLLDSSVASNIGWGTTGDRQEIVAAARAAQVHDFITSLPAGYDTELGDRGIRLSGGQRQRLGLARALIGNKRLLILDEATSALDSVSEHEVIRALDLLKGNITVLMVAHRLSTLHQADRIVVFDQGRITEVGSWNSLLKQKGSLARLWDIQRGAPEEAVTAKAAS